MIAPHGSHNDDRDRRPPADGGAAHSVQSLVDAGLPLEAGLRALSEEVSSRRLRRTLVQMSDELAAGESPDEVLAREGRGLPGYARGLVRAGTQSGQLGQFLEEFLLAVRRRKSARQGYQMALAYPLLLLPFTIVLVVLLTGIIVPQFKEIFMDFGVELPAVTKLLILISDLLTPRVLVSVAGLLLAAIAVLRLMPYLIGRAVWTRLIQRLPLIGPPSRLRGMSEFCSFLGLLISGRIPLPEALQITSGALQDPNLRSGSRALAARISSGETLTDGASNLPNFSPELRSLFHWEGRGTTFGEILRQAGMVFAARSHVQLGVVGLFFQPLLLLLIGGVLAISVIALFMPLIKLLNDLA